MKDDMSALLAELDDLISAKPSQTRYRTITQLAEAKGWTTERMHRALSVVKAQGRLLYGPAIIERLDGSTRTTPGFAIAPAPTPSRATRTSGAKPPRR